MITEIPIPVLKKLSDEIIGVLRGGVDPEYIEAYYTLQRIRDNQETQRLLGEMDTCFDPKAGREVTHE